MSTDLKKEFWNRMEDVRAGMLGAPDARLVPMSHYVDERDPDNLWFITAKGTDISNAAIKGDTGEYVVSSKDESLYARIDGHLSVSHDDEELDHIWNGIASAWFEGDKNDPDVQLVRFKLTEAEVWTTGGSLNFLFQIAKAHLTDQKPDMGDHGTIHF